MRKTAYRIMTNDGRFVSQQGGEPILVRAEAVAYVWDTQEQAAEMLPKYAEYFRRKTAVLALAVQPVHELDAVKEQTAVERAAGLYETALQNRRGSQCSEQQFHAARDQARDDVRNVLVLEGMVEPHASEMARGAELLWDAKRRRRVA